MSVEVMLVKIYELIKSVNSKVSVKDVKIMEVKKYYTSLYRVYMVYMYDKGFISDPTVFDTKEILGNIVDMNISHMVGVSGKVELSEEYIGYALMRNKGNDEALEFLSLLLEVVRYRNISLNIDKLYDAYGYSSKAKEKIYLNITQAASRVVEKGGYSEDEGVLKCIHGLNKNFKFVSLDEVIYKTALEELGIPDESYDSLFVKGLSREEEIRFSSLILNGLVHLDGVYADKLTDWLRDNKWSDNKFTSKREGLYNWVLYIKSNNAIEEQSKLLNSLLDEGYNIVGMKSNGFFVEDTDSLFRVPVGLFSVCSDDEDGELLPEINKLEGYTGEVYSLAYLENNNISYVGCPIELYVDGKNKGFFVDKEQTELKGSISWFKYLGADISFTESVYSMGVFQEDSLEDKLYKFIGDSEGGSLIGYLDLDGVDSKSINSAKKAVSKKL